MPDGSGQPTGVVFPEVDGRRSTSATGQAVVADALRPVDPVGAAAAARETNWRSGYLTHFRRLVEAGLTRPEDARAIAGGGLTALHIWAYPPRIASKAEPTSEYAQETIEIIDSPPWIDDDGDQARHVPVSDG